MNQSPFGQGGPHPQRSIWSDAERPFDTHPPQAGTSVTNKVLIVLAGLGLMMLLVCLGIGGAGYYAIKQYADADVLVPIQQRPPTYEADLNRFNELLAAYAAADAPQLGADNQPLAPAPAAEGLQAEVDRWFQRSVRQYHDEDVSIPVNVPMFLEACRASHMARNLPLGARVALKLTIDDHFPEPELETFTTVLGIDVDENAPLATIHFLTYDGWSLPFSMQWFVVKADDQWQLYDWQRLEYGRRISDEYGNYFANLMHPDSDGFDEALQTLAEQITKFNAAGEVTPAIRSALKSVERKKMLPQDRPVALLRTAWTWQQLGEQSETLRVLQTFQSPELQLGVLATRVHAMLSTQDIPAAIETADLLQKVSPYHPSLADIRGDILSEQGKVEEAVKSYLKALRLCPQWQAVRYAVLHRAKPQHVAGLVAVASQSDNPITDAIDLAETWMSRGAMLRQLASEVQKMAWDSAGFDHLTKGLHAYYHDQFAQAGEQLLLARQTASDEALVAAATRWLQTNRLEAGDFTPWMLEADDLPQALRSLAVQILDDELTANPTRLRDAMAGVPSDDDSAPYARLLISISRFDEDPEQAIRGFDQFLADAKQWERSENDASDPDELQYLVTLVRQKKTNGLTRLGRLAEAFEQCLDDDSALQSHISYVVESRDTELIRQSIDRMQNHQPLGHEIHRLRLQAILANLAGAHEQADELRRQALQSATALPEDQMWVAHTVARERGEWIVRGRITEVPVGGDDDVFRSTLSSMRELASGLLDEASIRQVEQLQAGHQDDSEPWSYRSYGLNRLDSVAAEIAESAGDLERAEALLRRRIGRFDDDTRHGRQFAARDLVRMLCRSGRFGDARQAAQEFQPSDSKSGAPPLVADVLVAEANWDELESLLAELNPDVAGQWISDELTQQHLQRFPDIHARLASRFMPHYVDATGGAQLRLLLTERVSIGAQQLTARLTESFGQSVSLQPIKARDPASSQAAMLVAVGDVTDAYVLSIHHQTVSSAYSVLSPIAQSALDQCQWNITIQSTKDHAEAIRGLWRILQSLLEEPMVREAALACDYSHHDNILWASGTGSDSEPLAERLRWTDRIPIDHYAWTGIYLSQRRPGESQHEQSTAAPYVDWEALLEHSARSVPAQLRVRLGGAVELVPCEVIAMDEEAREATVRIGAASQLRPWLQPGLQCRTSIHLLSHEP